MAFTILTDPCFSPNYVSDPQILNLFFSISIQRPENLSNGELEVAQNASSEGSTDSGHSEDINVFASILANIRLDRLPLFATSVRELEQKPAKPRDRIEQFDGLLHSLSTNPRVFSHPLSHLIWRRSPVGFKGPSNGPSWSV